MLYEPQLNPRLMEDLVRSGVPMDVLQTRIAGQERSSAVRNVHTFLGSHSRSEVDKGVWHSERDGLAPLVRQTVLEVLEPWIKTSTGDFLPVMTIKEIGRILRSTVDLAPEYLYRLAERFPMRFSIGGREFTSQLPDERRHTGFTYANARLSLAETSH